MKHLLTYATTLLVLGCSSPAASGDVPPPEMMDEAKPAIRPEQIKCIAYPLGAIGHTWTCGIKTQWVDGITVWHIGHGATYSSTVDVAAERWAKFWEPGVE